MEAETNPTEISLKWLVIWRTVFLHPTIQTFSRIIDDPKVSIKWGMVWVTIASLIFWLISPLKDILGGVVAETFGPKAYSNFILVGFIGFPLLSVSTLLINSAIAHGFARLFNGRGAFYQLVYCWGVIQLPFIVLSLLPLIILPYLYRLFFTFESNTSVYRIILFISILLALAIILYLFYAEVIAFSTTEKFSIGKGLGLLILATIVTSIASACLSYGLQAMITRSLHY